MGTSPLDRLHDEVVGCRACPRLVSWREAVAVEKRASFRHDQYWGKPVPGFGDPAAGLLVVGLAPAAHGGNRTGRVFTGDRSGDWLYRAMWRAGFANQPTSEALDDGLELRGAYVAAAVRCAPPANKPTPEERDRCLPYLGSELDLLTEVRVVVVLGQFALDAVSRLLGLRPRPAFGHLVEHCYTPSSPAGNRGRVDGSLEAGRSPLTPPVEPRSLTLICSFHPSQQNTFTGRLTEPAFDAVFARARELLSSA